MDAVLIIGRDGQLGRCLAELLHGEYRVTALGRAQYDLNNPEKLRDHIEPGMYTAVVNCAAYTAVDQAESEPERARQINETAVGVIASICHDNNTPLVHISTDYVYDNGLTRPLVESDPVAPKSVYGKTKLNGERAAINANNRTYILRTSWVYSEFGKNFVRTMLALANRQIHPKVVHDQVGSPTYARDLALAIREVLSGLSSAPPGVYNFCNAGETSWNRFAEEIYALSQTDIEVTPITTKEFGAVARRPSYSVLDTSLFTATFGMKPRSWRVALADCIARLSEQAGNDN